jgi:hypothetical protein
MTASNAAVNGHLSNDLLVRAIDEELSGTETMTVEMHLAACEQCRVRKADLCHVSDALEAFVHSLQPETGEGERAALVSQLETSEQKVPVAGAGKTLARFGWVLAAAAALAMGVTYLPFLRSTRTGVAVLGASARLSQAGSPFEIDGETFQYLPYSNPDLPLGGSHVVQMQVPISSLADAGVLVEPTANRMTVPDAAVLADVLLGMDGQPIGVHVLSAD